MFVRSLELRDFRSWPTMQCALSPGITVFVGRNGFGKTNLLESLQYVANLSSHRVSSDGPLVRTGAENAKIVATVENSGRELTVELTVNPSSPNRATINGAPRRPREVLGILRSVMFSPEDLQLVRGDPGDRRRFLDELIAMSSPRMAAAKSDYDRVLRQRSALLKTASSSLRRGGSDAESVMSTLDVWDGQLATHGAQVMASRIDMVSTVKPFIAQAYSAIAPHSRPASVTYQPSIGDQVLPEDGAPADVEAIAEALLAQAAELRTKEIDRGVCLVGPHRDEVALRLGTEPAKGFASHGESWSLALSMRLGSVELIRAEGVEPVLMLDDVFAELDAGRRSQLAQFAASAEQVLITAAVPDDIPPELAGSVIAVRSDDVDGARVSSLEVPALQGEDDQ